MTTSVLFDDLGPRGRRRTQIASAVTIVIAAVVAVVCYQRLESRGQFGSALWRPLTHWDVDKFLLGGLVNTLKAAVIGMILATFIGALMALGRLGRTAPLRWLAGIYVEIFRSLPLLLLILFPFLALPHYGIHISPLASVVLGLTLYNSAMLCELFRAGILSLDKGQREAAESLGMTYWQAMLVVIIPQAIRRMVPGIVSQLVTLLKDTALGYVVTYEELLRRARNAGDFYYNPLQMFFAAAVLYFTINFILSRLARRLEARQRSRFNASPMNVAAGTEELAAIAEAVPAQQRA